jgi:hypothetical protein
MIYKEQFNDAQWYIMQCAPVYVLSLVAGIDGKVDKKEIKNFTQAVIEQSRNSFGFCQEMYQSIISDIEHVMRCDSSGKTALAGLIATNVLLKKVNDTDATLYKRSLVQIGNEVAQSSGGLFKKRGDKETQVLAVIIKILELA